MTHHEYLLRTHENAIQKSQTYIMFCDCCGTFGHSLPTVADDPCSDFFMVHANCGGNVRISDTTTHDMLNHLSTQQAYTLHDEIHLAMHRYYQALQQYDALLSDLIASERKRINTHAPERLKEFPLVIDFKTAEYHFEPEKHPRCPKCNSLLVDKIRFRTRLSHFFFRNPPENLQGKTMECLECWHRW